jgi:fatty-acyl-CoA synthase
MQGLMMDYPLTINALFERARRYHRRKEIVSRVASGIHRYTYADFARRVDRLANVLTELGIKRGDRVATFAWNSYRHYEVYFAAPCMGAVCHPLNVRLFPDQLVYIANHAGDSVVFVDESLLPIFEKFRAQLTSVKTVVVMADRPVDPRHGLDYEKLLAAAPAGFDYPVIDEREACSMCYTSGTTGNPKAVLYSHRSTVLHTLAVMAADVIGLRESDVLLAIVPMFHANAWGLPYGTVATGATVVLPGPHLQPAELATLIQDERVTFVGGVPTIIGALYQHLKQEQYDVSSLSKILVGGAACPSSLMEGFAKDFGVWITHAWGMTETSPIGSIGHLRSYFGQLSPADQLRYRLKQGMAAPLVDIRIVSETGQELPWDGVAFGELQVRGPWIISAYYNDSRNPECFMDGWFRTGDVASIDSEGYIQLVDRTKDVVKSGGEWISSVDLENAIMSHPQVAEAAVIGIHHPKWQERPLACVVPKPGAAELLSREVIISHIRDRFATWWLPNDVVFIPAVPKTSVGKFDKKVLREQFKSHQWPE